MKIQFKNSVSMKYFSLSCIVVLCSTMFFSCNTHADESRSSQKEMNENEVFEAFLKLNIDDLDSNQVSRFMDHMDKSSTLGAYTIFNSSEQVVSDTLGILTIFNKDEQSFKRRPTQKIECEVACPSITRAYDRGSIKGFKDGNVVPLKYWTIDRDGLNKVLHSKKGWFSRYPGIVVYPALKDTVYQGVKYSYHTLVFGPFEYIGNNEKKYKLVNDKEFYDFVDPCPSFCSEEGDSYYRSLTDSCSTDPCNIK